ncbi:MAG: hypothetical protein WC867_03195 [Candidatus Pacearchaeota archaeon]|jgi:hypothetical protein
MTEQFEIVDRELLEREITSKRFISGLERAIEISTYDRSNLGVGDLEILYEIKKEVFGSRLYYPDTIIIGDEKSVSLPTSYDFANQLYKKFGQINPEDDFEFTDFCSENRLLLESYPKIEPEFSEVPDELDKYYTLFHFHTHPSGEPTPSIADTEVMTSLRSQYHKSGLYVKPIMVIIGTCDKQKRKGSYPILFFQEKSTPPIDIDREEARKYANEYYFNKKKKTSRERVLVKRSVELINFLAPNFKFKRYKPNSLYKCGLAYFQPDESKLDMGFDIGKFSYVACTKTQEERK